MSNVTNPVPQVFDKLSACPPHPSLPTNNQPNNLSLDMILTSSAPTTLPLAHVMPQPGTLATLASASANSQPLPSLCASAAADSISCTLVTGPSLPMEETVEHHFTGDGTLSKKPSSKLLQHLSQGMPNAKLDITQGMTSSQQQAVKETAVHEEVMLCDIVEGCSDDREGNYFDEYGGGVSVKSSIDLSHVVISEPTSEEIISLAEFIGDNVDNTPFLASQEPSDDEQYTKPDMGAIHHDSENEITEIPLEFHISPREKKGKYMKTMPNYVKLAQLPVEKVDCIPWDVDGDHHYTLSCTADKWVDFQRDGRWYNILTSSWKGLEGVRKVGSCQGSWICKYIDCPKLQSEGVCNINPKEFTSDHGAYICKCCGYYAVQTFCGSRKITEFDRVKKELNVWYEGKHNCIAKPDILT